MGAAPRVAQLARAPASIAVLVALLLAIWPATGRAANIAVDDAAGFAEAIAVAQAGDTILLAVGTYPLLRVEQKNSLTLQGSRGAEVAGVLLEKATDIHLRGFTVTPPGTERAEVRVKGSTGIVLDDLLIDGRDERVGAGVITDDSSSNLVIQNSELTNCGAKGRCVGLSRDTVNTLILNNTFHDCFDCDFIRSGASQVTVKGNTFDRAVHNLCTGGALECHHIDHIQIAGGGPWTIIGNKFGVKQGGAASIYVSPGNNNFDNPIHDVRIISNYFSGDAGLFGVKISDGKVALIRRITVINNTILSGSIAGLQIEKGWKTVPENERPLVANNVFAAMTWPSVCGHGQFSSNLTMSGVACSGGDGGPANLAGDGRPTVASHLVIDRADPGYAPAVDYAGFARGGPPDRGAFEYGGSGPLPTPPPAGVNDQVPLVGTIMHQLRTSSRRLYVYARLRDDVGVVKAELRVDGRVVSSKSFTPSASKTMSFSPSLRRVGRGKHTVAVTAHDGHANLGRAAFTVTVRRGSGTKTGPRIAMLNNSVRNLPDEALRVYITAALSGDRALRRAIVSVDGVEVESVRFRGGGRSRVVSLTLTEWHLPHGTHTVKVAAVDGGKRRGSATFTMKVR